MSHACLDCGACCFSDSDEYVALTVEDRTRLGDDARWLVEEIGGRAYLAMRDGHCAALELLPGRLACSIYDRRPEACRDLERGSPACLEEVRLKKRRVLRAFRA